jgi:hypothetical protein
MRGDEIYMGDVQAWNVESNKTLIKVLGKSKVRMEKSQFMNVTS